LQSQLDTRGMHAFEIRPTFAQVGDDTLIGSSSWLDADGRRTERHIVLQVRDGKIADMQVCATYRDAKRFARR
jgi:hypothetical protein